MMSKPELFFSFYDYVPKIAAFTTNKVPSKFVEKTPYEIWHGNVTNMSFLKVSRCETYVKHMMSGKLESKSDKYVV